MSGQDLYRALNETIASGYREIAELRRCGVEAAQKRAAWKRALAAEVLRLRAEKVPVSIVETIAKGDPDVATAEMEYLVADTMARAAQETVMMRKKEADVIREQISREYVGVGSMT